MKHTKKGQLFTELVIEIFKVSGALVAEGDRLTAEHDLTSARWKILGAIARSDTPLTVPQIARSMGQTRQAVQRLVEVMNTDGLLELLDNPNHKRARLVTLSEMGNKAYAEVMDTQVPWANDQAGKLSEGELLTALTTLKKIMQSI